MTDHGLEREARSALRNPSAWLVSALLACTCSCGPGIVPPPAPQYRLPEAPAGTAADAADLFAGRITPANAESRLVGGPDATGGIDDWALSNGVLCAVVSDPDHEAVLTPGGGLLVDLGHCDRADDQWPVLQLHLLNLSASHIVPVDRVTAETEPGESRIVTHGALEGLEIQTTYALDTRVPDVLRVTSHITRAGPGMRLFMVGDTVLHGRRSLAPFVLSTRTPRVSVGFRHPPADPDRLASIVAAIHPADLHVLVGTEDDGPGISYGLLAESAALIGSSGGRRELSFLALNGEHYTLLGVFTRPLWFGDRHRIGWLQVGQTPFMRLRKGETLEVRRVLVVGRRADAAVITDRFFPDAPRVSGRVDDPRTRIHVEKRMEPLRAAPFTVVRPDADGKFAFHAAPGRYTLQVRTPGLPAVERDITIDRGDVGAGHIATGAAATLRLPRDRTLRLVFLGLGDTPDPSFDDDLLDFRSGGVRFANSASSREVLLAATPDDPEQVTLAPGRYRVLATRGPEYEVSEAEIRVRAGEVVDLTIEDPPRAYETPGWIAADLHVHAGPSFDSTLPLGTRVRGFVAQGGELVVSTEHDFIADYGPVIHELGLESRLASLVGTEVTSTATTEVAPHTIGHSNVFPVRVEPLAYRRGALRGEGRRLRDVVQQARELHPRALLQLNHPRTPPPGGGSVDSGSYFTHLALSGEPFRPDRWLADAPNRVLLEPDAASGLRDIDFDLIELMNGASPVIYRRTRADWLSLLLQGEIRTGTANSDSHDAATPVALPRSYVRVPDDRPEHVQPARFLAGLRAGHVIGTTGPWLAVTLGEAGPGEMWQGTTDTLRVEVRSSSWAPVSRLRIRVNAELVHAGQTSAGRIHEIPLRFDADALITVEIEGEAGEIFEALLPGGVPLAFANPVFVDADADGAWTPPGLPNPIPDVLARPDGTP